MWIEPSPIPAPKPDDKDYMKVWHLYLQEHLDHYKTQSQRDTWRRAFYAVAAILFALMFGMLALCGSKFFTLHSCTSCDFSHARQTQSELWSALAYSKSSLFT